MFAIKHGTKFIDAQFYCKPNEVFKISVRAKPKTYKTLAEAQRVMELTQIKINKDIVHLKNKISEGNGDTKKASKEIKRLTAILEDLYNRPFKEVEKKVQKVREQIEEAKETTTNTELLGWFNKELIRIERINSLGMSVVKVNQSIQFV